MAALQNATGGDTILLQSGDYSGAKLSSLNFSSAVTIESANANAPAVLQDLQVLNTSNVSFKNVGITADDGNSGIVIQNSQNISVDGADFHGAQAGAMLGKGLLIRGDTGVSITNSQFHDLQTGLTHLNDDGVVLANNSFHEIAIDGIQGGGTSDISVSGNSFTNFAAHSVDHPDAIQFWTLNTTTSAQNISVTDNLITRGEGTGTQGIFFGDEAGVMYHNVTITGNTVLGGYYQGLSLYDGVNANISNNTVVGYTDQQSWIKAEDSSNVTMNNNITSDINNTNDTGLTQSGNTTVAQTTAQGATAYVNAYLASHGGGGQETPPPPAGGGGGVSPPPVGGSAPDGQQIIGQATDDNLTVASGNNYMRGAEGNDTIQGGTGFDDMNGNQGNDSMHGGAGDDWVVGGKGNDVQFGDAGNDIVLGNLGADTLNGGAGDDVVRGGQGDDYVSGGQGNDFISGDRGNDTVIGGGGADTFHGSQDAGIDKVMDFSQAQGDRVMLDHGTTYSVSQVGSDTVIDMGGGNQMILANV
jgi:parallel beta-helix repeat protein